MNKTLFYAGIACIIIGLTIIILFVNTPIHCPPTIGNNGCNNSVAAFPLYVGIGFTILGVVLLVISFTIGSAQTKVTSHQESAAKDGAPTFSQDR